MFNNNKTLEKMIFAKENKIKLNELDVMLIVEISLIMDCPYVFLEMASLSSALSSWCSIHNRS